MTYFLLRSGPREPFITRCTDCYKQAMCKRLCLYNLMILKKGGAVHFGYFDCRRVMLLEQSILVILIVEG